MTLEVIKNILSVEGYISHVDSDGDLAFKAQGRQLYASVDENDEDFVRIFLDTRISADVASEFEALEIANNVERKYKCVKCMLLKYDGNAFHFRVAVETFSDEAILERSISRWIDIVCTATYHIAHELQYNE